MGEKPGQMAAFHSPAGEASPEINKNIEVERGELGRNIQKLRHQDKTAADWRVQFQKSPLTYLGLAFGGGLLLSAVSRGAKILPVRTGAVRGGRSWETGVRRRVGPRGDLSRSLGGRGPLRLAREQHRARRFFD